MQGKPLFMILIPKDSTRITPNQMPGNNFRIRTLKSVNPNSTGHNPAFSKLEDPPAKGFNLNSPFFTQVTCWIRFPTPKGFNPNSPG